MAPVQQYLHHPVGRRRSFPPVTTVRRHCRWSVILFVVVVVVVVILIASTSINIVRPSFASQAQEEVRQRQSRSSLPSPLTPPHVRISDGPNGCSLNGEYDTASETCNCDKPWTGTTCSKLDVLPVKQLQGYGMIPNQTSWGGSVIYMDGQYHLYVSVMKFGKSLRQWTSASEIQHAVSTIPNSPEGPYVFQDVAIPVLSHNPRVVELADRKLAMFHIFNGVPINNRDDDDDEEEDGDGGGYNPTTTGRRRAIRKDEGSTIHTADSPYGPWEPLQNNTLDGCNNPAPFVVFASCEKAHVIYIVCRGGKNSGVGGTLKRSDDIYGPWEVVSEINPLNNPPSLSSSSSSLGSLPHHRHENFNLEDPTLWIDSRGYHIIYHAYVYEKDSSTRGQNCTNSVVSAYVYSHNGQDWYFGDDYPYSNSVTVLQQQKQSRSSTLHSPSSEDHYHNNYEETKISTTTTTTATTTQVFATRERPTFIFDRGQYSNINSFSTATGDCPSSSVTSSGTRLPSSSSSSSSTPSELRITHLLSAVCGAPSCPEGPPGGCVNCKYDHWDFTLIQPLAT
jgi:hypothetical protein